MTTATSNLIVGLISIGLANTPAAILAIQGALGEHAKESPEEAAQITMAIFSRVQTLTLATDARLDAVDTSKPPVPVL